MSLTRINKIYEECMQDIAITLLLHNAVNITKLKKCPICGNNAICINPARLNNKWRTECLHCFAHTKFYNSKEKAAAAWNTNIIYSDER